MTQVTQRTQPNFSLSSILGTLHIAPSSSHREGDLAVTGCLQGFLRKLIDFSMLASLVARTFGSIQVLSFENTARTNSP